MPPPRTSIDPFLPPRVGAAPPAVADRPRRLALQVAGAGRQVRPRLQMAPRLLGFQIVPVDDAASALELLGRGLHPDLVLADAQAGGVTEPSFAARLRAGLRGTPIVVVGAPAAGPRPASLAG